MRTSIQLTREIYIDNHDVLIKALKEANGLELSVVDSTDDSKTPQLDLCLEHIDHQIPATLWVTLGKQEAIFFAKSILALAESI
jgi:hypothetical protein